jgi:glycosyltransferase involved in cell wall biosynthesis
MKEKRLSVITVNRNNADGLARTISSVLSQSYLDFEFIIIDGASDDKSPEIIRENASHLSYWISEPDKGTYHAMNKGIRVAKGEYCLFLNSGDYLVHSTVLEKVFSYNTDADIISGDVLKIRPNNKFRRVCSPETISLHKLCIHSLPHQATLIRTSLFKEIGYYTESYKIASDWEFFLKALVIHEKSYMHIDEDVSYFKIGGVSSSRENFAISREESHDCLKRLFPKMEADLMEYRYFYNSNFGQIISLIKKNKRLYKFIDDACGILLNSKKRLAGK